MTDSSHSEYHGPAFRDYMVVFGALTVFTSVSFITNALQQAEWFSIYTSLLIIMAVSVVKATLVTMYFMHMKWDWRRLYFIAFPLMILTLMMIIVLLPDTVLSRLPETGPPGSGYQQRTVEETTSNAGH